MARAPFAALPVPMVTAWLLLGGLLVLPALDASATGRGVGAGAPAPTRLATLAAALEDADELARMDFAAIALDEMLEAYSDEVNRARAGVRAAPGRNPGRWAAAAAGWVGQLQALADAVARGAEVRVRAAAGGTVELWVAGRPVEVAGPRISEPGGLEARIFERFCVFHRCELLLPGPPVARADRYPSGEDAPPSGIDLRRRAPRAASHWSFADREGPSFVTADGLEFRFHDVSRLNEKRLASQALAGELRLLGESLGRLRGQGVAIDTEVVAVRPLAGSEEHHVAVNRGGDYLRLPLPALERAPLVVELARPWLAAAARGEAYQQSFPHAEVLLAELIGPSGGR